MCKKKKDINKKSPVSHVKKNSSKVIESVKENTYAKVIDNEDKKQMKNV